MVSVRLWKHRDQWCQTENTGINGECQTENTGITGECQTENTGITGECQTENTRTMVTNCHSENTLTNGDWLSDSENTGITGECQTLKTQRVMVSVRLKTQGPMVTIRLWKHKDQLWLSLWKHKNQWWLTVRLWKHIKDQRWVSDSENTGINGEWLSNLQPHQTQNTTVKASLTAQHLSSTWQISVPTCHFFFSLSNVLIP